MDLETVARRGECAARLDDVCTLEDLRAIVECPPSKLPPPPQEDVDVFCAFSMGVLVAIGLLLMWILNFK
jgi:hypothetical protein